MAVNAHASSTAEQDEIKRKLNNLNDSFVPGRLEMNKVSWQHAKTDLPIFLNQQVVEVKDVI